MKKRDLFIFILALQTVITSVYGQVRLSEMEPSSTDSLQRSSIRYFSPGKEGINRVWDFSGKLSSRESSKVMFMKDSMGVVSVIEPSRISYYRTTPDTLILFSSESPLEKREYAMEKVSKIFPLEYGDSVIRGYQCEGVYCGNHLFREAGTITLKVDANGSIVLAENDTIRNVQRVHTIDAYAICMDSDSAALDTAKLTQIIDERYEWYLPGAQYPIIENITSTTYLNMDVLGTTKYAYCNLPEDQFAYYITSEDDNETEESETSSDDEQTTPDIIHYQVETQGKVINISYSLDEDAVITTIVANYTGTLCVSRQWTQSAGQGYAVQIDCNGLRPGIYILYINVNGKVYSEKVKL